MDCLMFINRIVQQSPHFLNVQYLVSGSDSLIRNAVVSEVLYKCKKNNDTLIIIDDTGDKEMVNYQAIINYGYQLKNGMSGEYCLYNPFRINTIKGISRIRQLLSTMEYDEKQKGKLISYLNFIRHLEFLEHGTQDFELTLNKLGEYCTVMCVEEKLQSLVARGIIDERQQMMLLAKYSECASAGADLEDMFFILMPYISNYDSLQNTCMGQAIIFPTGELGEDEIMKSLIMQLIQFGLEEDTKKETTLLIFDKGYGNRKGIYNLIKSLTSKVNMHVFSEDIFTLGDEATIATVLGRFNARIYSRHAVMSSAEAIEKACGEVEVAKKQKTITYDRRLRANSPWDILLGNNKTEAYTQMAPIREPRYYKEMIMSFISGSGIVEFMGETSVFTIKS